MFFIFLIDFCNFCYLSRRDFFFHWSLSDSKSPQLFNALLSIPADQWYVLYGLDPS